MRGHPFAPILTLNFKGIPILQKILSCVIMFFAKININETRIIILMEYDILNLLDLQPENIKTVNIVHDKDVVNINVT